MILVYISPLGFFAEDFSTAKRLFGILLVKGFNTVLIVVYLSCVFFPYLYSFYVHFTILFNVIELRDGSRKKWHKLHLYFIFYNLAHY